MQNKRDSDAAHLNCLNVKSATLSSSIIVQRISFESRRRDFFRLNRLNSMSESIRTVRLSLSGKIKLFGTWFKNDGDEFSVNRPVVLRVSLSEKLTTYV